MKDGAVIGWYFMPTCADAECIAGRVSLRDKAARLPVYVDSRYCGGIDGNWPGPDAA
jgi:hypothetical protein